MDILIYYNLHCTQLVTTDILFIQCQQPGNRYRLGDDGRQEQDGDR